MYKKKDLIEKIVNSLNLIKLNIGSFSKLTLYDLNDYSEDFFCHLLNIVFDLNLKNLNIKDKYFIAIDLGDTSKKVCYQITSSNDSKKIKKTIEKFEKYKLYYEYKELFILILDDKKNYRTPFKSNGQYQFQNNNIFDLNDILQVIKSKDVSLLLKLYEFIEKNMNKFEPLSSNENKESLEFDINNLLLEKKEIAINKYNLRPEIVESLIIKLQANSYDNYQISEDDLKIINNSTLFFQSIKDEYLQKLSHFITIYFDQIKYAIWKFDYFYKRKERLEIDSYLFENILRILNNLNAILKAEINILYSNGFGNYKDVSETDNIIVSISNDKINDNKIIFLDINKNVNLGFKFCLGGISEKVENIKKVLYEDENYILANSRKNIYLWNINKFNSNPLKINKDDYLISDYEVFEVDTNLHIIAITKCSRILVWKVIEDIVLPISNGSKLQTSGYILINVNGENKIIKNDRYSKTIYKYDIKNNIIEQYFKVPDEYNRIVNLDIHPIKNQIAFSYSIPDTDDSFDREYMVFEFENFAVYDIDNKIELFQETEEGHFIENLSYIKEKDNIYLAIYDRDGGGHQYQPLVKIWREINDNKFIIDYVYDSYPIEKNLILYSMKFIKNKVYFYTVENSHISKIENLKEKLFYKLSENYIVNDIY